MTIFIHDVDDVDQNNEYVVNEEEEDCWALPKMQLDAFENEQSEDPQVSNSMQMLSDSSERSPEVAILAEHNKIHQKTHGTTVSDSKVSSLSSCTLTVSSRERYSTKDSCSTYGTEHTGSETTIYSSDEDDTSSTWSTEESAKPVDAHKQTNKQTVCMQQWQKMQTVMAQLEHSFLTGSAGVTKLALCQLLRLCNAKCLSEKAVFVFFNCNGVKVLLQCSKCENLVNNLLITISLSCIISWGFKMNGNSGGNYVKNDEVNDVQELMVKVILDFQQSDVHHDRFIRQTAPGLKHVFEVMTTMLDFGWPMQEMVTSKDFIKTTYYLMVDHKRLNLQYTGCLFLQSLIRTQHDDIPRKICSILLRRKILEWALSRMPTDPEDNNLEYQAIQDLVVLLCIHYPKTIQHLHQLTSSTMETHQSCRILQFETEVNMKLLGNHSMNSET
jgi:hypothetical protein